ncbi:MAG: hypothetical protein JWO06_2306 [Bacteroidota bacterium]|nr:hypothetical protein [Bacteroidota bacterium]
MKTNILLVAAIALSLNTNAQKAKHPVHAKSQPVNTQGSDVKMLRNIDNSRFSIIDPKWEVETPSKTTTKSTVVTKTSKDGLTMLDNRMFVVKNGATASMNKHVTLKNGSIVMINGVVIKKNGKVEHLNNGDSIDMSGHLSCKSNPLNHKEQAAL